MTKDRIAFAPIDRLLTVNCEFPFNRVLINGTEYREVGADALNTQTTPPDSVALPQSVRRAVDLVLRIAERADPHPVNWTDWKGLALTLSGELRHWKLNDSGKSGHQASKSENGGDDTLGGADGAVRADFADVVDLATAKAGELVAAIREQAGDDFAYVEHNDGPAGQVTHQLGTVSRDTLDPSAAEQRERFEAIAGKPRPSAANVKAMLGILAVDGEWLGRSKEWSGEGGRRFDGPAFRDMMDSAAAMIDSLGVHLLAMELERDELAGKLRKLAEAPTEPADIAELVQNARMHLERMERAGIEWLPRAKVMAGLIAALNDQVGKVRELTAERDRMEVERDAARDVLSDARDDAPVDIIGDALRVLTALMLKGEDPGTSTWSGLVSRMRWAMMQTEPQMAELRATVANLTRERDAARRHAESDRQNLAESVKPWLWVHDVATAPWVPAELRTKHWGQPTGRMAEAIVHWLRGQIDQPDQAQTYTDDQRRTAIEQISAFIMSNTPEPFGKRCARYVDVVAAALGMKREGSK